MQTSDFLSLDRLRAFHVEFFGPTNNLGARVRVKDQRNNKRIWLPYNYVTGDILKQAAEHLWSLGIVPHAVILHDSMNGYTLGSKNFSIDLIPSSTEPEYIL
tara:strand:- start:1887 stop:2192 length:306 start_codon:yes stop_codon:yes gene_type:complete